MESDLSRSYFNWKGYPSNQTNCISLSPLIIIMTLPYNFVNWLFYPFLLLKGIDEHV